MRVRLTHIDGKLPNLALMKLAHWHKSQGHEVVLSRNVQRDMLEPDYDVVYGSAIFTRSYPLVESLKRNFPGAIVSGTGSYETYRDFTPDSYLTVEKLIGVDSYESFDYSIYPEFTASLGFTQRGCRFKCGWCMVPATEGKPKSTSTIANLWRGDPYPKHIHLLDNDFFGQSPESWRARVDEVIDGGFRVCLNQGINIRVIDEQTAEQIARLPYYDDAFKNRTLYTAWDSLGDRKRFETGVLTLRAAGVPSPRLLVYMLIGFDPRETWGDIFERFNAMVALGVRPYPMVYNNARPDLRVFQRWVIRRYYLFVPWADYVAGSADARDLHERAKSLDAGGSPYIEYKRARRVELQAASAQPMLFGP